MNKISMATLNTLLARMKDRRVDIVFFVMSQALLEKLVGDSIQNYHPEQLFHGCHLYRDVVQAFGRNVITGGEPHIVSGLDASLATRIIEPFDNPENSP